MYLKRLWAVVLAVLAFSIITLPQPAYGIIDSCYATVTPQVITRDTTVDLVFQFLDTLEYQRVEITRPNEEYTLVAANGVGWNGSLLDENTAVFVEGGVIDDEVTVRVTTGSFDAGEADWLVSVADNPGGVHPTDCNGVLSTTIEGSNVSTVPPIISGLGAHSVTTTSATIKWLTNEPATSRVDYGLTNSYGSNAQDAALKTEHSIQLSGLTAGAPYHFRVTSIDSDGNSSASNDNTFSTPAVPLVPITSVTSTPSVAIGTPTEFVSPTVTINMPAETIWRGGEQLSGAVTDNQAIALVEYSIDGGLNWLPIQGVSGLGTRSVNYSFTPDFPLDGNYQVLIRATDTSGNAASTNQLTIIIDREVPSFGGLYLTSGGQRVPLGADGRAQAMVGLTQDVSVVASGGATTFRIDAIDPSTNKTEQSYYLAKDAGTSDIWRGAMSFARAGAMRLEAYLVDGAGNQATRSLGDVSVLPASRLVEAGSLNSTKGTVTVFTKNPDTDSWQVWDAEAFGQLNPLSVSESSGFALWLPPGTYYIHASAPGYRTRTSDSFVLTSSRLLSFDMPLKRQWQVSIGVIRFTIPVPGMFNTLPATQILNESEAESTFSATEVPFVTLASTGGAGGKLSTVDALGEPTLYVLTASWLPDVGETIDTVKALTGSQSSLRAHLILSGEKLGKATSFWARGGYDIPFILDPSNTLADAMNVSSLPAFVFVDRHGIAQKIIYGNISEEEVVQNAAL